MNILKITIERKDTLEILEGDDANEFIKTILPLWRASEHKDYTRRVVHKIDNDLPVKPDWFINWGISTFGIKSSGEHNDNLHLR